MSLCGLKCDFQKIRAPSSESWEKPRDDVGCSARWRFCTKSYDCFTWFRGWINCQSVQCLLLAIIWITACGALHILSQTFINPIFIDKLKICSSGYFGYVVPKGQTKPKWFFQADVSYKKQGNKFYLTTIKPQVDLFMFVFGGNWRQQIKISLPLKEVRICVDLPL